MPKQVSLVEAAISVIVPVFNGARFVGAAVRSVLGQTHPPAEVIVVDDGSSDDSAGVAEQFGAPVVVMRQPHRGGASALNAGVARSSGRCLAFIDADDLWGRDKLARQVAVLAAYPDAEAIFGRLGEFIDRDGAIQDVAELGPLSRDSSAPSKACMLIRREAFQRIGAFDPSFVADFPEWYARAMRKGLRGVMLDAMLTYRRIHDANTSMRLRPQLHSDYLRIARTMAHRAQG